MNFYLDLNTSASTWRTTAYLGDTRVLYQGHEVDLFYRHWVYNYSYWDILPGLLVRQHTGAMAETKNKRHNFRQLCAVMLYCVTGFLWSSHLPRNHSTMLLL